MRDYDGRIETEDREITSSLVKRLKTIEDLNLFNRVGGNSSDRGISDLSHHRTYRSVYGGSINLTSDTPFGVVVYHGD